METFKYGEDIAVAAFGVVYSVFTPGEPIQPHIDLAVKCLQVLGYTVLPPNPACPRPYPSPSMRYEGHYDPVMKEWDGEVNS